MRKNIMPKNRQSPLRIIMGRRRSVSATRPYEGYTPPVIPAPKLKSQSEIEARAAERSKKKQVEIDRLKTLEAKRILSAAILREQKERACAALGEALRAVGLHAALVEETLRRELANAGGKNARKLARKKARRLALTGVTQ